MGIGPRSRTVAAMTLRQVIVIRKGAERTDGEVFTTVPAPVERDERDGAADRVNYGFNCV